MKFGYWMPVFGGWLRNQPDEGMEASWDYVTRLTQRSEQTGWDLSLIAELNLNDIKGVEEPAHPGLVPVGVRGLLGGRHLGPQVEGALRAETRFVERLHQSVDVVAVHPLNVPAERLELRPERLKV